MMILRSACETDASSLRAILYKTFESTWLPQISRAAAEAFRQEDRPAHYVAARGLRFHVAVRDDQIAGFVDWEDDFVNALHVHSSYTRTGVGARLMDLAEREIGSSGHALARLETDTFNLGSQAFYAARGYREADRYPDLEWNSGLTTLLLVKPLR
ncbi:GNAT family N-acetyltransferase [Phenylobacterium sp.]|uniref:GNAT family N-acetyltransferase n=1 Tax=Phenylobacterium sp. TaxID=1871053 RepID=UPI0037CC4B18